MSLNLFLEFASPVLAAFFGLFLSLVGWGAIKGMTSSKERQRYAKLGGPILLLFGITYFILLANSRGFFD